MLNARAGPTKIPRTRRPRFPARVLLLRRPTLRPRHLRPTGTPHLRPQVARSLSLSLPRLRLRSLLLRPPGHRASRPHQVASRLPCRQPPRAFRHILAPALRLVPQWPLARKLPSALLLLAFRPISVMPRLSRASPLRRHGVLPQPKTPRWHRPPTRRLFNHPWDQRLLVARHRLPRPNQRLILLSLILLHLFRQSHRTVRPYQTTLSTPGPSARPTNCPARLWQMPSPTSTPRRPLVASTCSAFTC